MERSAPGKDEFEVAEGLGKLRQAVDQHHRPLGIAQMADEQDFGRIGAFDSDDRALIVGDRGMRVAQRHGRLANARARQLVDEIVARRQDRVDPGQRGVAQRDRLRHFALDHAALRLAEVADTAKSAGRARTLADHHALARMAAEEAVVAHHRDRPGRPGIERRRQHDAVLVVEMDDIGMPVVDRRLDQARRRRAAVIGFLEPTEMIAIECRQPGEQDDAPEPPTEAGEGLRQIGGKQAERDERADQPFLPAAHHRQARLDLAEADGPAVLRADKGDGNPVEPLSGGRRCDRSAR